MKKLWIVMMVMMLTACAGTTRGIKGSIAESSTENYTDDPIIAEGYSTETTAKESSTSETTATESTTSEPTTSETKSTSESEKSTDENTTEQPLAKDIYDIYQADVYEYLALREAPTTTAQSIALLVPEQRMLLLEKTNETMWLVETISTQSLTGYVQKDYLIKEGETFQRAGKEKPVKETPVDNTIYYANVKEFLNLREKASTKAKVIGKVDPMGAMKVLETSGKMKKVIVLDSGDIGWVNGDYLTTKYSYPKKNKKKLYVYADVSDFLTVRKSPSTKAKQVVRLNPFTEMIVLEEKGAWYRIQVTESGKKGWVAKKYTSKDLKNMKRATEFALVYIVNAKAYITLRSSPSTKAPEVTKITAGSYVVLLEQIDDDFWKIQYTNDDDFTMEGFVLKKYLMPA